MVKTKYYGEKIKTLESHVSLLSREIFSLNVRLRILEQAEESKNKLGENKAIEEEDITLKSNKSKTFDGIYDILVAYFKVHRGFMFTKSRYRTGITPLNLRKLFIYSCVVIGKTTSFAAIWGWMMQKGFEFNFKVDRSTLYSNFESADTLLNFMAYSDKDTQEKFNKFILHLQLKIK
jgi:hypothetical protein